MDRPLVRILTFLIIPALLTDPITAEIRMAPSAMRCASRDVHSLFVAQAFSGRLTSSDGLYSGPLRETSRTDALRLAGNQLAMSGFGFLIESGARMKWIYGLFMTFVVAQRLFETYRLPKRARGTVMYRHSLTVMTLIHLATVFGSIAEFYMRADARSWNLWIAALGLLLYGTALALRNWAKDTLAKHWSLQIEIQPGHQVVRSGPYQYMRHPAYTAIMMEAIGLTLVGNAYYTLVLAAVPYVVFLIWRARAEERALVNAIGEPYRQLQRAVPPFVPWPRRTVSA